MGGDGLREVGGRCKVFLELRVMRGAERGNLLLVIGLRPIERRIFRVRVNSASMPSPSPTRTMRCSLLRSSRKRPTCGPSCCALSGWNSAGARASWE